jgi:hypothetical protein
VAERRVEGGGAALVLNSDERFGGHGTYQVERDCWPRAEIHEDHFFPGPLYCRWQAAGTDKCALRRIAAALANSMTAAART